MNGANPASSNVSSYSPDGSAAMEYLPSDSVTTVRVPCKDGDRAVTVTPGRMALCESVTVPVIRPWSIWANAGADTRPSIKKITPITRA